MADVQTSDAGRSSSSTDEFVATVLMALLEDEDSRRYAPYHHAEALSLAQQADALLSSGDKEQARLLARTVQVAVDDTQHVRELLKSRLQPAYSEFQRLQGLGAYLFFPTAYSDLLERWDNILVRAESDPTEWTGAGVKSLLERQRKLEIRTTLYIHTQRAQRLLESSKDMDGHKWAESSYRQAKESLATAVAAIEADPRDQDTHLPLAFTAFKQAQHTYYLTQQALGLEQQLGLRLRTEDAEPLLLHFESKLGQVAKELGIRTLGDSTLDDAFANLAITAMLVRQGAQVPDTGPADHRWLICEQALPADYRYSPTGEPEIEPEFNCADPEFEDLLSPEEDPEATQCWEEPRTGSRLKKPCRG